MSILSDLRRTKKNSAGSILGALKGGNPVQVFNNMMQNNPQFRQFVQANKGKSIQQIAQENGIPMSTITSMMGGVK